MEVGDEIGVRAVAQREIYAAALIDDPLHRRELADVTLLSRTEHEHMFASAPDVYEPR